MDELRDWLALYFVRDIGPITVKRLLSVFQTPGKILGASRGQLSDVEFVGPARAKTIKEFDAWDRVDKEIGTARKQGVRIIKYTDREYPESLRQIESAPIVLYVKGEIKEEDKYSIAMVGSRRMTEYGRIMAEKMASELASSGLTIVSGMARGIDTCSHRGALKVGGRTIAVLGSGLDQPYPPENRELFEKIAASSCVISEFPLGTPPNRENFPRRNRLISAISLGVLVVEAASRSGSLITADYALEQGKDIFAVPGQINARNSEGTNGLIKKGAKLVQDTRDILEEMSPLLKGMLRTSGVFSKAGDFKKLDGLEINDEEKALCTFLGNEVKHIDILSRESRIPPSRLLGLLLGLEIKGIIKQSEGNRFYMA